MPIRPRGYEVRALRRRHGLTQKQLAESMYEVSEKSVRDYENGRRHCSAMNWWAMVLTHDKLDLWVPQQEKEWIEKFRRKP
jgi:transcriptional regulator with XRE-family HTH domain